MPSDCLPFKDTGYFSNLICDYLAEANYLKPLYNRFPNIENFKAQIQDKQASFSSESRSVLVRTLEKQYQNIEASDATKSNIQQLKNQNTFTVTTGHQLNLFTGPLYFLHKITSAINLAKQLKSTYAEYNFVPIYWMASEDHDFEEINYFNFKGKKIQWNKEVSGAVGELNTEGLASVFEVFKNEIGPGKNATQLLQLFENAYLNLTNLADATRYLANQLFAEHGLVIIDANESKLKRLFIPQIEKELETQVSYKQVSETNKQIETLGLNTQVNPREINLFYNTKNLRERIVLEDGVYKVLNTNIIWNKTKLLKEVNDAPEHFSPNVILRPLYQEVILPNLCYIGGGGELAYWFQLKANFEANNVVFPMLLLRNSVLIKTENQAQKQEKLELTNLDLFLKQIKLTEKKVKVLSTIDIDFSLQKEHLKQQFKALYTLAEQTDKSFVGAVAAQEKKQTNGLQHLEKRLLKAQKRQLKNEVDRIVTLQNELFPNGSLQERNTNFSELYLEFGTQLIPKLIQELKPLKGEFTIITL